MDARTYFERKRDEARKLESEYEKKRFDSPMRVAGWRADVCDKVLVACVEGATISDEDIARIEVHYADNYHFTSDDVRDNAAYLYIGYVRTKIHQNSS